MDAADGLLASINPASLSVTPAGEYAPTIDARRLALNPLLLTRATSFGFLPAVASFTAGPALTASTNATTTQRLRDPPIIPLTSCAAPGAIRGYASARIVTWTMRPIEASSPTM